MIILHRLPARTVLIETVPPRAPTHQRSVTDASGVSSEPQPEPPSYVSIRTRARYSGLSVRTLRKHLCDPISPIPHYRVGGKILVNRREFDD
jgi:hypothetical protein